MAVKDKLDKTLDTDKKINKVKDQNNNAQKLDEKKVSKKKVVNSKTISKEKIDEYSYDKDILYEEVVDDRNFIHKKNVLFLLFILIIFVVIYLFFPKFELYGLDEVVIDYNDEYTEAGYKARTLFGDITDNVLVSDNIVNGTLGDYRVDYEFRYLFFKIKKSRKVTIVDRDKPTISLEDEDIKLCPNDNIDKIKYNANDEYDGDITNKVSVSESGSLITFSVYDDSGNYFEKIIDVGRIDNTEPKITLYGQTVMYINLGTNYVEPGYSAIDNCDGDITQNVTVNGTVGSGVGNYKITYMVTDSSNNKTEITRTVIVRNNYLYNNGSINNGTIYLTFDDGPSDGITGYILDVLKEEGVKATFFVTCNGPDYLIKRMYDEGHTVALHTATHNYSYIYSSVDNYFADLQRVSDRVKRITSVDSKIIRFPGGSSNTVSRQYQRGIMTNLTYQVLDKGYRYYDWNVDSGDAGGASSSNQVYYNVINNLSYNRSNVVLMHDTKYTTRGAIRNIIRYGKSNGYRFDKITMDTYMVRHGVNN